MVGAGAPNTKFAEAIEHEHTTMFGCEREFTTSNYLVTTTPRKEYEIATGRRECPEGDKLDRKGRRVRVIRSIDALKTLEICRRAGLRDYEILAVVRARKRAPGHFRIHQAVVVRELIYPAVVRARELLHPGGGGVRGRQRTPAYAPRRVDDRGGCDDAPQQFDGAGGH